MCCELKPVLGDEYPCVLRKMKTQIELTKNDKRDFGCEITRCYILIIGSFTSVHVTKDELITIFKQSHIRIIFTDEIFDNLPSQHMETITLEDENNLLRKTLLQAEDKIKFLEKEILLLKTPKQSKTISDNFGKK